MTMAILDHVNNYSKGNMKNNPWILIWMVYNTYMYTYITTPSILGYFDIF